jgi:tol-pal system protein YbgF
MMKARLILFAGICAVAGQAHAGLFNDDEARQQIQQVSARVTALEDTGKKQAESNETQAETNKQQTRALLDLQSQVDNLSAQLRNIVGQNEDLNHALQDAEKRQKDFYIDLDTRLRHFEAVELVAPISPAASAVSGVAATDDVPAWDRAFEAAHALLKAGKPQDAVTAFQEFLKRYPASVYVPNVYYEMGGAYFQLNDFKKAQGSYETVVNKYSFSLKTPEAVLGIGQCKQQLKQIAAARKAYKQVIAKYPDSEAAKEAKKRLATLKK